MLINSLHQQDITLLKRYNLFKELFSLKMYEDLQDEDHEKLLLTKRYEQIQHHKLITERSRSAVKCTRLEHAKDAYNDTPSHRHMTGHSADYSTTVFAQLQPDMRHTVQHSNAKATTKTATTAKRRHQRPHSAGVKRNTTAYSLQPQQPNCKLVTVQIGRNCNMNELRVRPVSASCTAQQHKHETTATYNKTHSIISDTRMLAALQQHVAVNTSRRPHSAMR
jgi:hypothetical protein